MTRVPTALPLLLWDQKTGPYRATPHPTTAIVEHALAVIAADAADLLTSPTPPPRLDRLRLPALQPLPAQARPPPVVLHPLRLPRPCRRRLRPPHRDGVTAPRRRPGGHRAPARLHASHRRGARAVGMGAGVGRTSDYDAPR